MKEIIIETLLDASKLLPFLFVTFLIMEYIEHKFSKKSKEKLSKTKKFGPLLGSVLGAFPQCGFSIMAVNLYATRIITVGTLISIFLSTSDEMLPILISGGAGFSEVFNFLLIKVVIGTISGFVIDFVLRKENANKDYEIKDFCLENHCDCKHSIFKSSLKHTFSIFVFIIGITFLLNIGMEFLGKETISKLFLKDNFLSPFISSLIGLIPNCASSVVLTELYLNDVISFASCMSGLLTGSGVALILLFKVNKNMKDNFKIILTLYLVGALSGSLIEFLNMLF